MSDKREVSVGLNSDGTASTASTSRSDSKRPSLEDNRGDISSPARRLSVPTTGMRGGLGRTLLTAFLILTIVPLSLVGWYAIEQNHRNAQQEMERRLRSVAVLKAEELRQWFTQFETLFRFSICQSVFDLEASTGRPSANETEALDNDVVSMRWWENLQRQVPNLSGVSYVDAKEKLNWSIGECSGIPGAEGVELPSDRISLRADTGSRHADLSANAALESSRDLENPSHLESPGDDIDSVVSGMRDSHRDALSASTIVFSLPQEGGAFMFCLQWNAIKPVLATDGLNASSHVKASVAVSEAMATESDGRYSDQTPDDYNDDVTGHIYLVQDGMLWPDGRVWQGAGVGIFKPSDRSRTLDGHDGNVYQGSPDQGRAVSPMSGGTSVAPATSASYVNHLGVSVIGAYSFVEELGIGVLVEQEQVNVLTSSDRIATTLIALTLAVALTTTIIAAVVIRQITRPVIMLTESALAMAEGDLNQHLQVASQDEIGILTYVFNKMAAELNQLYAGLEAKVAERTKMLQRANYQIQQRAIQLKASQEVGQAITSMRDSDALLYRVVDLIRDRFLFASVAIYLVEPGGGEARLQAIGPAEASWPKVVQAGDGSVIEKALRKGTLQVASERTGEPLAWQRRTLTRIVVPLRMGERILGTLAVLNAERELGSPSSGVAVEDRADDLMVLELLANQVAVALENAQAYERERHAARKLEEAEAFKAHFLANMSHELREPLNTIMGFTRLMLKGLDGPLTPAMTQDLDRIYDDSQHLLALINDILAISEIQAGLMELKIRPMDLQEVVDSVMPTANALVRGKDIVLVKELDERLPLVRADPTRVRQVLIHLLTNAAKFTEAGNITIQAWHDEELVYVSVSDTGVGIPPEDRERIFTKFATGVPTQSREGRLPGVGLGLALSKEFVELHGGQIWVKSEVGKGTTFTFSLPYYGEGVALSSPSDLGSVSGLGSASDLGSHSNSGS